MTPQEQQCISILNSAATSTYGIVVKTSNAMKTRAALYRARIIIGDSEMKKLQIRVSPDDSEHEVWIIRRLQGPEFALIGLTSDNDLL